MADLELRKTILIGLGGAGQLILTHVKRFFLDSCNVLPPCIRLLALDTDASPETLRSNVHDRVYKLDPQEFLHLRVAQARDFVESDPVVRKWYIGPVTVAALENGAGAIRQNGRMALFYHMAEVKHRIGNLTEKLNDMGLSDRMQTARATMGATTDFRLSDKAPEIYVCGSLAGGTGSGTFLDIGLLLHKLMPTALIHGYFLLNWAYRNKAFAHRVRGNAYAALAELDNLQSIKYGVRSVPYTMRYADLPVTADSPPYSLFHIIDGRNERGESIDDVRAICETVANAIFLSVSAMSYPTASATDNLLAHISTNSERLWEGRNPRYSSFGVAALCYPALQIQRFLVAQNALELCRAAITDVEGGMLAGVALPDVTRVKSDVQAFFTDMGIARGLVAGRLCPYAGEITCEPQPFEIADPTLLPPKAEGEERQLVSQLAEAFTGAGARFIATTQDAFRVKLADLERDATLTSAYRRQWMDQAIQVLRELDHEAASQLNDATGRITDRRGECQALLDTTTKSRHLPWLGGPRKSAAARWGAAVVELLESVRAKTLLEHERRLYETLLAFLQGQRPATVPTAADAVNALRTAAEQLSQRAALEDRNLRQLKAKPTVTLVGEGNGVIVPHDKVPFCSRDSVRLSYDAFKTEQGIHTMEDYLEQDRDRQDRLPGLFLAHCEAKLKDLTTVSVHQALEVMGKHRGDAEAYLTEQLDDLFRKAAPLWRYHRSRISALQSMQYDHVINIGVDDPEAAHRAYGSIVTAVKAKHHIRADHSFSAAGDSSRIWLLSFAAALPVYFLQGLEECRERYEDEITPTYHIDPLFEMNVPDLFPVTDIENRTLRVLGMAIVRGIDVVRDEKLPKGHKFICDLDSVKAKNFGEPKVWFLFREMLAEVRDTYDPQAEDNLLDLLVSALKAKVTSLSREALRRAIQAHIENFERKLAQRDFSRLISARLTYRETKELKDFLDPRCYAMDMDRYIAGR